MQKLQANSQTLPPITDTSNGPTETAPKVSGKAFLSAIRLPQLKTIITGFALASLIVTGLVIGISSTLGGLIAFSALGAIPFFLIRLGPKDQPETPSPMPMATANASPTTANEEIPAEEETPAEEEIPTGEEIPTEEMKPDEEIPTEEEIPTDEEIPTAQPNPTEKEEEEEEEIPAEGETPPTKTSEEDDDF